MGVTSQRLTPQRTGQVTIMEENITAATQAGGIMEGILAEVTLVGGITNGHWEKAGARDVYLNDQVKQATAKVEYMTKHHTTPLYMYGAIA